jgi:LmbE family N-acetylglucosaminyl deacetylase
MWAQYVSAVATVAFLHAHPDDEAVFTGGTMARLAADGHRVVLVVATGGELGAAAHLAHHDDDVRSELLAAERRAETDASAAALGVCAVHFLGYRDSGMSGDAANDAPGSLWSADLDEAAAAVAEVLRREGATELVTYDPHGIYGHPDHVQVHRAGVAAARLAGLAVLHEVTVDREHLHFVETHLVEEAVLGGDLGLVRSGIGSPTVEVDVVVDVRPVLAAKRTALGAHASQLPEHAPVFGLDDDRFAEVYGWEWYLRRGEPGAIDGLA